MDIKQKLEKLFISYTSHSKMQVKHLGYSINQECANVIIYKKRILGRQIVAACENSVIAISPLHKTKIYYYPDLHSRYCKLIHLDKDTLPGLIPGSTLDQCMLIPYIRNIGAGRIAKAIRIVLITDKCQVFHNNPARGIGCEGYSKYNDDIRFEESAIWDMPGRRYPSKAKEHDHVEKYYPFLPDEAYEYHPVLNTSNAFSDTYQNGGFGKTHKVIFNGKEVEVSRFYFPKRMLATNSFHHIGGEESDYKMTIIGTYRANNGGNGARTVVMATTDGGRNWFAKYEFGDSGEYEFAQGVADWRKGYGNALKLNGYLPNLSDDYCLKKREVNIPNAACKDPVELFNWSAPIKIKSIVDGPSTMRLTTIAEHNLQTGNIIALRSNNNTCPLCNNTITAKCGGNGTLYKVEVIDAYTIDLYEYIHSPHNNICCRHIHQINRIKDGWLIGTGEVYPNGWLLYMQMREADTYSHKEVWEEFDIFRLNSTPTSVQRTLGAIMLDDKEQTLIYASDHDTLSRDMISVPEGRSMSIMRNSTGVFKGKLSDIDNRDKFEILYEAIEPSFLFKKIHNRLVFAGMRGELAISDTQMKAWDTYRIDTDTFDYHGTISTMFVLGDLVVKFK